jgi:large subunit ribosomal protein L4
MEIVNTFFESQEKKKKAIGLIHRVYLTYLKNSRKYTASTKTRSEVRGGGRKPWRQKGTGRARAGSIRSPLWGGGGVSFGPKPRIVSKKVNKKERRLAILSAFYLKEQRFIYVEDQFFENFSEIKTKTIKNLITNFQLKKESKILFVLPETNANFWLSSRNIPNIESTTLNCLNLQQILKADHIVLSKFSFEKINKNYGN